MDSTRYVGCNLFIATRFHNNPSPITHSHHGKFGNPFRLEVGNQLLLEQAMNTAVSETGIEISEFTVAPKINPEEGLPYHEWFIEFEREPDSLDDFAQLVDSSLQEQNSYYYDLIEGKVLQPLKITQVKRNGFTYYMKSEGKLGGQNKLPRLSNDRKIADKLKELQLTK